MYKDYERKWWKSCWRCIFFHDWHAFCCWNLSHQVGLSPLSLSGKGQCANFIIFHLYHVQAMLAAKKSNVMSKNSSLTHPDLQKAKLKKLRRQCRKILNGRHGGADLTLQLYAIFSSCSSVRSFCPIFLVSVLVSLVAMDWIGLPLNQNWCMHV